MNGGARPATLCYIRKEGRTLMVYRNKKDIDLHKGMYVAPGGKIEPEDNGDLENTMLRETEAETGLIPKDYALKGFLTFVNDERLFSDRTTAKTWGKFWDVAVYVAKDYEGTLLDDGPEGDLEWILDGKLSSLPMHEGDRMFTSWLDRQEYFIATFLYKNEVVKKVELMFFMERNAFLAKAMERYGSLISERT